MRATRQALLAIIRVFVTLCIVWSMLTALWIFLGVTLIDFPCFVEYDPVSNTVWSRGRHVVPDDVSIEVLLNVHPAYTLGGMCHHAYSKTPELVISTSVGRLVFRRQDEDVLINGTLVRPHEDFQRHRVVSINPWFAPYLSCRNLGRVSVKDAPESSPRLVISGAYGSRFTPLRGVFIVVVLVTARRQLNKLDKDRPNRDNKETSNHANTHRKRGDTVSRMRDWRYR